MRKISITKSSFTSDMYETLQCVVNNNLYEVTNSGDKFLLSINNVSIATHSDYGTLISVALKIALAFHDVRM